MNKGVLLLKSYPPMPLWPMIKLFGVKGITLWAKDQVLAYKINRKLNDNT